MRFKLSLIFSFLALFSFAQKGTINGVVLDAVSKEPVPFANVVVTGTQIGASTDIDGKFTIEEVPFGYQKLEVSVVGYQRKTTNDVYVTQNQSPYIEINLNKTSTQLKEVTITSSAFDKPAESPVSLQTIGVEEIERNPGANRDVSRVIQSLPGVTSTPSFRNDILIRGGAPNENQFYIDGVETPVINHFQTQGSSGGPVGILNANLLKKVNLYTGAFPSNRGGALSSVLEIEQKEGNKEALHLRGNIGASEVGLAVDGPIGEKTTYNISARQSYLQFLFQVLRLPFLPTFNDGQFKIKHKFNEKNQITFVGLGAFDQFRLNESVNDGLDPNDPDDAETIEENNYTLGNIPINEQYNYTIGAVYKHFEENSFQTVVVSRNALNNSAYKYRDNDESDPSKKILDYNSTESENKMRLENTIRKNSWKVNMGVNLENARYTNNTFNRIATPQGSITRNFESDLTVNKYAVFGQISRPVLNARLDLSFGFRLDGNDYNSEMQNPLNQFSPRFSASYSLTDRWSINFNTGRYHQLPAYTALGFSNSDGTLINKERLKFIQSDHVVAGVQYNPDSKTKITVEGFYKFYRQYPFSLSDSISLANLGADFGVIGNGPIASTNKGRAYGAEFLIQRKAKKGLFGILSYTFVRSEFEDVNGDYVPSSWDAKHILTLTAGKKFKNNWQVGLKWRFVGGLPYTPYNVQASALKENWNVRGAGLPDYSRLNERRLSNFQQLDLRVDKTWYFKKWSLNLYFDIQNAYNFKAEQQDNLNVEQNANGEPITDPNDPSRYELYRIDNEAGTVLPTLGIIFDI
jgi:outer membrane receptor for ferrienterochelin and colicin